MALRSAPLWLLLLGVVALQQMCLGSSSHSLKIASFAIVKPSQELSQLVILGYMDDQIVAHYDSDSRKIQPRVSWMEKMRNDIPHYWQAVTDIARSKDNYFRDYLENLWTHYNQSKGFHILQEIASCDLQGNGSKEGFLQTAYDWELRNTYRMHPYDIELCIELLEKCLSYGKEMLLRTEPPVVTVTRRMEAEDGMETYICRVHGFYPKEIDAAWKRDGEVWLQDTLHGSVAPNTDGTYHYWLSIQIDPKERGHYRCHVEHDGLQEPLDVAMKAMYDIATPLV
ncbi:major histocompatibility complex class I-related gene protein-like [Protobothrops mucrosquamatus]|uniref:major histocompatibility complex class I-related gene protein-like n=1 Tax=Protobothrops mucrosquamatus TaxID=103944 RepID=UPI000775CF7C|nr:major histocompatibility complex class I-related gene protein-like [Protobothrops mucrosquamatus]